MGYTPTIWKKGDIITAQKLNKMENAMHTILSDYTQTIWADGDIISAEKLNKLENAIEYVNLDYIKTVWENNDIVTASLLNKMENGIEMASVEKTWEEMSWNNIIAATKNGKYKDFEIGAMKELDLGSEGVVNMQIVGIDADDLADGSGKAPLTFISKELLETSHRMNPSRTPSSAPFDQGTGSVGGWGKCEMRTYLKETIKPLIPEAVRNAIVSVTKYSRTYDMSETVVNDVTSIDDVWIPSAMEVCEESEAETVGATYSDIFESDSARIKEKQSGTAGTWPLRSAKYNSKCFGYVLPNGTVVNSNATNLGAIALGFCL